MYTLSHKSTPIEIWTENPIEETASAYVENCPDSSQPCQGNIHSNLTIVFLVNPRFFSQLEKKPSETMKMGLGDNVKKWK